MAVRYQHVTSLEQERCLLKAIIDAETEVRASREKKRLERDAQARAYGAIFEPITATMRQLKETRPSAPPVEHDLLGALGKVEDDTPPLVPIPHIPAAVAARSSVKKDWGKREDGLLGLNESTMEIGGLRAARNGDVLTVYDARGERHKYEIDNPLVWRLLLYNGVPDAQEGLREAIDTYRGIARDLDLVERAKQRPGTAYDRRRKYTHLLAPTTMPPPPPPPPNPGGKGFLFSLKRPTSFSDADVAAVAPSAKRTDRRDDAATTSDALPTHIKPSTIVIPSDKRGLLTALARALGEYRAGNSSMRQVLVPLAQAARRRGVLPAKLLTSEESTWVYT